jgi:hypothetical protein
MRSFAHVEHPHLRQRPVALSACASHSGQALHVASRSARISAFIVGNPFKINLDVEFPNRKINSSLDFKTF